jgi:hypothetical protein
MKILLIEDNRFFRIVTERILTKGSVKLFNIQFKLLHKALPFTFQKLRSERVDQFEVETLNRSELLVPARRALLELPLSQACSQPRQGPSRGCA